MYLLIPMDDFKADNENQNEIMKTIENEKQENLSLAYHVSQEIQSCINYCYSIIDKSNLYQGLPNLDVALIYLTKVTEYKNIQDLLISVPPIDQIKQLFSLFQKAQIDSIQFKIIDLFVNLSFFLPDFVDYFSQNDGIPIIQDMISPLSLQKIIRNTNNFKSLLKLIHNISSYYPDHFEEDSIIDFIQYFVRMDAHCQQIATSSIINFFRKLSFTTQTNNIKFLNVFHQLFRGTNSIVRQNILWCIFYNINTNEFFVSDLTSSKLIHDIIDSISDQDNYNVAYMALNILSHLTLYNNEFYMEAMRESGVFDVAVELVDDDRVGSISLQFINNVMTHGTDYIEIFLQKQLYSHLLELYETCEIDIKKECFFFWSIVEMFGNEDQKRVIEQDIFVEALCGALDFEDEDLILVVLQTLEFMFQRNLSLIQYLDTDAIVQIESSENENIQTIISSLHEMYDQFE